MSRFTFVDPTEPESWDVSAVVQIVILICISVFGTIGNALVIITIRRDPKLRIPGNYFIINLTVSDIIITAFSIPVIISNLIVEQTDIRHQTYIDVIEGSIFCQSTAYLKVLALHVSWYSLAFIALNRYYSVCRVQEYANFFTKKRLLATIALIWMWVVLINIPIMAGWAIPSGKRKKENSTEGYYYAYQRYLPPVIYDGSSHDCVLGVNTNGGYTYANGLFVMSIPLVSIIFCYSLVYMEIVRSRRKMKKNMNSKQLQKRCRKERKISFMLAVVVVVFILCWAPAIIYDYATDIVDNGKGIDVPRLVFCWLALSNSAMNPGLYALLSKAFRLGYKKVFMMFMRKVSFGSCRESLERDLQYISSTNPSKTNTRRGRNKSFCDKHTSSIINCENSRSCYLEDGTNKLEALQTQNLENDSRTRKAVLALRFKAKRFKEAKKKAIIETSPSDVPSEILTEKKFPSVLNSRNLLDEIGESQSLYSQSEIYSGKSALRLTKVEISLNQEKHREDHNYRAKSAPLVNQMDDSQAMFTEYGIYLGGTKIIETRDDDISNSEDRNYGSEIQKTKT